MVVLEKSWINGDYPLDTIVPFNWEKTQEYHDMTIALNLAIGSISLDLDNLVVDNRLATLFKKPLYKYDDETFAWGFPGLLASFNDSMKLEQLLKRDKYLGLKQQLEHHRNYIKNIDHPRFDTTDKVTSTIHQLDDNNIYAMTGLNNQVGWDKVRWVSKSQFKFNQTKKNVNYNALVRHINKLDRNQYNGYSKDNNNDKKHEQQ